MGKHAELPASGAERWMVCAGSYARGEGQSNQSSWFAMEGTAAHSIAEYHLDTGGDAADSIGTRVYVHDEKETTFFPARIPEGGRKEQRLVEEGYVRFEVDEEMAEGVQLFLDVVRAKADHPVEGPQQIKTEFYMDMGWLHPLIGGTADAHIFQPDFWIDLFDLKYGAGVVVEVKDNAQQKTYAVGLLKLYPTALGVRMHIVQPRAPHADGPVRPIDYTRAELLGGGDVDGDTVVATDGKPYGGFAAELFRAAVATQGAHAIDNLKAGEHCRFCKGKVGCPELHAKAQELARMEFADDPPDGKLPVPTDAAELSAIMNWIPVFDAFIKDVEGAVQRELEQGRDVPDYKLVRKKTNRAYIFEDDEVVAAVMAADESKTYQDCHAPPKVLSPAQMEKLSKKAKVAVAKLARKPEGGLTVAHITDKREAVKVGSAKDAFPDDLDDGAADDPLA